MNARPLACLLLAAHLAACTTLRPVDAFSPGMEPSVAAGESIRLVLRDGRVERMTLSRVTREALCEGERCVAMAEVHRIAREEVNALATLGLVAAVLLVAAVVTLSTANVAFMPGPPAFGARYHRAGDIGPVEGKRR